MITALVLAGGRGERFWPKSRKNNPKHLLRLSGKDCLLSQTIKRLTGIVKTEDIWVVTNQEQAVLIRKLWKGKPPFKLLTEPEGRNTAAAIGLAAVKMEKVYGSDTVMIVLSADHWVGKIGEFKNSLRRGINLVREENGLVSIGVKATRPETGFGYIEKGYSHPGIPGVFKVKRFIEKPELARAKKFYADSRYLWNSGIFIWKFKDILAAFNEYLPLHLKLLSQINAGFKKEFIKKTYRQIKKVSIDYGIMERVRNVWTVEGNFLWEDVGSWTTWEKFQKKKASGNVLIGEIVPYETSNSLIWSNKQLVATLGIKNLVIIVDKDAILVCDKSRVQDIKLLVAKLKRKKNWQRYL